MRTYRRSLKLALRFRGLIILLLFVSIYLTYKLYVDLPKGYIPQDDIPLLSGFTQAPPEVSYDRMLQLQRSAVEVLARDSAVAHVSSSLSGAGAANFGRLFVVLKPLAERNENMLSAISRLRGQLANIPDLNTFLVPAQDIRAGARQGRSRYQVTVAGTKLSDLEAASQMLAAQMRRLPGLKDVNTDRDAGGHQIEIVVDRLAALRMGVTPADVAAVLANLYTQREVATLYGERNQSKVILAIEASKAFDPLSLGQVWIPGRSGVPVPLGAVATFNRTFAPTSVNHHGQFASVTIGFSVDEGFSVGRAMSEVRAIIAGTAFPENVTAGFAGEAENFVKSGNDQALLLLAALAAMYIILGVLYESYLHPITALSTLPSAGLGALLTLKLTGTDLTMVAFIGIILIIGLVKKNAIILIDYALQAQRETLLSPSEAILEASIARLRPLAMTSIAAAVGCVPLLLSDGPGAEIRRPLGLAILGGLVMSQLLAIYTTVALYVVLEELQVRSRRKCNHIRSRLLAAPLIGQRPRLDR